MDFLKPEDIYPIIMKSWKISKKNNVGADFSKINKANDKRLKDLAKSNFRLKKAFKSLTNDICVFLKKEYVFILTNSRLILLDYIKCDEEYVFYLEKGMFLTDTCLGTNAISLAHQLKTPVYLTPEFHYSEFFKEWYCFAVPLLEDDKIIGFLDVSTVNKELKNEIIVVTKLLSKLIINKLNNYNFEKDNIQLTSKQKTVLKYLVKGFTGKEVASKMDVSIDTINYHKKNLFKKLKVDNTKKAISKAIKMGIINIKEIDN